MRLRARAKSRAFTLVEMILAVILIGILAVSAVPALGALSASREAAAAREIRRLLQVVRLTAMSSGRPTGLSISTNSELTLMQIENTGVRPAPLISPLGESRPPVSIRSQFGGSAITLARTGLGERGAVTFWFGTDGVPHSRTANGTPRRAWNSNGTIRLSGGTTVTVLRVSGAIE